MLTKEIYVIVHALSIKVFFINLIYFLEIIKKNE